jgi:ketosteroid isomerase-like protein
MAREPGRAPADAEIRALVDDWAGAVRAKDVDAVMRHYAADVVAFDLAPPLQYAGADALRASLAAWFPTFRGPVGYDVRNLAVTAGADVAFCRSHNRISGTRTSGETTDVRCARPSACAGSTAHGRSRMSMHRCRSTWTAAIAPRWTSSRDPADVRGHPSWSCAAIATSCLTARRPEFNHEVT